jgi:hypothetical protein
MIAPARLFCKTFQLTLWNGVLFQTRVLSTVLHVEAKLIFR